MRAAVGFTVVLQLALVAQAEALELVGAMPGNAQQQRVVGGVVVDARSSAPVVGAAIRVQGAGPNGVTGVGGSFRFDGLSGETVVLEVEMVGYRTLRAEVRVGDDAVRLALEEAPIALDEVVVTGTAGGTERRALGNSVSRIEADRVVDVAPVSTLADLVRGRAAGVAVLATNGQVGAGSRIKIRGVNTFSLGSEPLLYIDGVRVNGEVGTGPGFGGTAGIASRLNDINLAEVERVEIIKGPAAATLYGTEASNGVIHVITKRGEPGASRVEATVRQGVHWFMDAAERWPSVFGRDVDTGDVIEMNLVQLEADRGTPIFREGHLQSYALNAQGGTDAVRYFLSGGYDRDGGIVPVNGYSRLSGRANVAAALRPDLDASVSVGLMRSRLDSDQENNSWIRSLYRTNPANLDDPARRGFGVAPPEIWWATQDNFMDTDRFTASLALTQRPAPWLSHRLLVGYDVTAEDVQELVPHMTDEQAQFFPGSASLGQKFAQRRSLTFTTLDYAASATASPISGIVSTSSLGLQYFRRKTELTWAEGFEFPAVGITSVDGAALTFGGDDFTENTTVGVYVQQQLGWRDRLFLTAALRGDDNSAFGRDFDFVMYPKLSASWVLSEEPFWSLHAVDALKLRAAWGASGQQPETFASLRTFSPSTGGDGDGVVVPELAGNPALEPERGEELELGFEASLFGQRVAIDFTYYRQRTENAIVLREVPPSTGFSGPQYVNAGAIRNHGVELLLSGRAIERTGFDLDFTINLSTNANEVLDTGAEPFIVTNTAPIQRHQPGFPIGALFDRKIMSAELDANGRAVDVLCDDGAGGAVACDEAPSLFLGRSLPNVEGGAGTTVTLFDHLRLHALVDFKAGHKKMNFTEWHQCSAQGVCEAAVDPLRFDPVLVAGIQRREHAYAIQGASYAKLREVSVSYTLPSAWSARIGASRTVLGLAAQNVHTWTNYPGLDPEGTQVFSDHLLFETATTPQTARLLTTLTITF